MLCALRGECSARADRRAHRRHGQNRCCSSADFHAPSGHSAPTCQRWPPYWLHETSRANVRGVWRGGGPGADLSAHRAGVVVLHQARAGLPFLACVSRRAHRCVYRRGLGPRRRVAGRHPCDRLCDQDAGGPGMDYRQHSKRDDPLPATPRGALRAPLDAARQPETRSSALRFRCDPSGARRRPRGCHASSAASFWLRRPFFASSRLRRD